MTLHGEDLARVGGALGEKHQAVGERGNILDVTSISITSRSPD